MKLQTEVEAGRSGIGISYGEKVLVLGSCFADNIGQKLLEAGFDACVNPFGTLYNPLSVLRALERLSSGKPFTAADCVPMGAGAGKVCSFRHHTSFARETAEDFLANANASLERAHRFFLGCGKVLVTFGTAYCFYKDGSVVSNCLKRPAAEFTRTMLEVSETEDIIKAMLAIPGKRFIFTVSPIRHMADGAAGNSTSKATLLLAIHNVCRSAGAEAEYFPAYEIVMDELRDYRFYAEDMVHPSQQTIGYLWERFVDFALPEQERPALKEKEKAFRHSMHQDRSAESPGKRQY